MKKAIAFIIFIGTAFAMPASAGYWIDASDGFVPARAYQIGVEPDGAPLFLCKALFRGAIYVGNINSAFGGCDISYNGNILTIPRYKVWVLGKNEQ